MRRYGQLIIGLLCLTALCGCEDTNSFHSSVPMYPVHAEINTKTEFVTFTSENTNTYITVTSDGYFLNGVFFKLLSVKDRYGYGGIVVFVSMKGYVAFDLGCPYCAGKGKRCPCQMDGIYAVCPECGEQYELASGYAFPQKGISHEALRELKVIPSTDYLIISQK